MCFTRWFLSSLPIKFAMVLIIWKQLAISSPYKMSSLLILPSMPFLVNSLTGSLILVPLIISLLIFANLATPDKYCDPDNFCIGNGKALLISHISSTSKPLLLLSFLFFKYFIFSMFYSIHYKILPSIHQFCKDKGFFLIYYYYDYY